MLGLRGDPRRLRGPDIAFVSEQKLLEHSDPSPRFARFAPNLAVEIDLTTGRKPGGLQRVRDYLESGVRLVWVRVRANAAPLKLLRDVDGAMKLVEISAFVRTRPH